MAQMRKESSDHLENSRTCRGNFLSSQKVFVDRRLHHLVARFCNVNYVMNRNDVKLLFSGFNNCLGFTASQQH